jgi:TatD DNase family protein
MIIDSHCHLDYEPLLNNIDKVILNAKNNNISKLLTIGTSIESSKKVLEIVNKFENVYGAIGIHPNSCSNSKFYIDELLLIKKSSKKIIAFGETGLDFFYNKSKKEDQIYSFEKHIDFSLNERSPVIVHTRDADDATLDIIKKNSAKVNFLIHCFTGSIEFAKNLLDLNCTLSFSGIITFKKAEYLNEVIKLIPNDKILVETDSPYLSPVPYRGKPNEPANVKIVLQHVAKIKNTSLEEMAKITSTNFSNLFFNEKK